MADKDAELSDLKARVTRLEHERDEGYQVVPHRGDHDIARNRSGYIADSVRNTNRDSS